MEIGKIISALKIFLGAIIVILGVSYFIPWITWFLPLLFSAILITKVKFPKSLGVLILSVGGFLSGIWAIVVLKYIDNFPNLARYFLTLHLAKTYSDMGYLMELSEFLGILSLISISSLNIALICIGMILVSKIFGKAITRIIALKIWIAIVTAIGILIVNFAFKEIVFLYAFVTGIIMLSTIINNDDPKDNFS